MLLWAVKGSGDIYLRHFLGEGLFQGLAAADKTGRGRSRWMASSYLVRLRSLGSPGTAGESLAGQHGCGSRIKGQAVPGGAEALAGGRTQVGVDLAGDVSLEAADDFLLRQAFFGAPAGVGAGRWVGAEPGDHDPVEGVVGLPVAAGVKAVAGDLSRGCGQWGGGAQVRPGGLRAQSPGMVAHGDQQDRGGVRADAVQAQQAG